MLNFAVDPEILAPHVPAGTELDFHHDKTYVSIVGFLFYHTIVCGLPIPRHRNFEEVNLRFYVRKQPVRLAPDTWRRGVVFIRELVPKIAIAVTARVFYGEPYLALPMRSEVEDKDGIVRVKYEWRRGNKWEHLAMEAHGEAQSCAPGYHEQFITEHYWGYTARTRHAVAGERRRSERTSEYPRRTSTVENLAGRFLRIESRHRHTLRRKIRRAAHGKTCLCLHRRRLVC